MSDYSGLLLWIDLIKDKCIFPLDGNDHFLNFLIVFDWWPIYLGYIMFGYSLFNNNYTFLLLTITNFIDYGINVALRSMIDEPNKFQPLTCPIIDEQMPALATERITVLVTVAWIIANYIYPFVIRGWLVMLITLSSVLAIFSRTYLYLSTPSQLFVGVAVGLVEGLILSFLFCVLKIKNYDQIISNFMENWYSLISAWIEGMNKFV